MKRSCILSNSLDMSIYMLCKLRLYINTYMHIYIYPEGQSLYFVYPLEKTELYREKVFFSRVVLG